MRRLLVAFAVAVLLGVWFVTSYGPDTPSEYAAKYGGSASQYEAILTSTDCQWLGERAQLEHRGFQRAATKRMQSVNCP